MQPGHMPCLQGTRLPLISCGRRIQQLAIKPSADEACPRLMQGNRTTRGRCLVHDCPSTPCASVRAGNDEHCPLTCNPIPGTATLDFRATCGSPGAWKRRFGLRARASQPARRSRRCTDMQGAATFDHLMLWQTCRSYVSLRPHTWIFLSNRMANDAIVSTLVPRPPHVQCHP